MENDQNQTVGRDHFLNKIQALVLTWARIHFRRFLKQTEAQLYHLAETASNSDDSAHFYQVRDQILMSSKHVENMLLGHIHQQLRLFREGNPTASHVTDQQSTPGLHEVGNDSMQEQLLALQTMVHKACTRSSETLYALNLRLSALSNNIKINENNSPIGPGAFAEGLLRGLPLLKIDHRSTLVICKLYDTALMSALPRLYAMLNKYLQTQGLYPDLEMDGEHAMPEQPQPLTEGPQETIGEAVLRDDITHDQPEQDSYPHKAAAMSVAETIEAVGEMFDDILTSHLLQGKIKNTLSYLRTPYLKLAMKDPVAFQREEHPAKKLLNMMVMASITRIKAPESQLEGLLTEIKQIAGHVNNNAELSVLEDCIDTFQRFLDTGNRTPPGIEEPTIEDNSHVRNDPNASHSRVEQLLLQQFAVHNINITLQNHIMRQWIKQLTYLHVNYGDTSDKWQSALNDMDNILVHLSGRKASELRYILAQLDSPLARLLKVAPH